MIKKHQKRINLSSILLLMMVVPFIMTYRLSPGDTPYWLFGLIFGLLLAYLGLDLVNWKQKRINSFKSLFLWLLIILVIGGSYLASIIVRQQTAPVYDVHDIILQLESVIQFFLQGKNPYAVEYFGTPLEAWHYSTSEVNPALYHFVMMPWYFLFSLPFYFLSISLFGFFDGRLPLLFLFFVLLSLAWRLLKDKKESRRLFLILLTFNPATIGYFLEGRSDIFMFTFLFWAWFLLEKKRLFLAGFPLGLAFATKQSSWPILPFYLVFIWLKSQKDFKSTLQNLASFVLVFSVITLPFFLWEPKSFLESTFFYLSGKTIHSYPVSGYGLGMLLAHLQLIKDLHAYYPFWIWQLIIGLPLAILLIRWLIKTPTVKRLIISYAVFTFVFWYFSRYFNNSHLGYLSTVFISAYGFYQKEK